MRIGKAVRRSLLAVAAALVAATTGWGQAPEEPPDRPMVLIAAIEGPIGPGTLRHVEVAVDAAAERGAALLILRLDTPGGLATSMREIIAVILGSPVPVAGYVAPPGAHAASAGTYILYATHIAAMAPGTNLGAATPVQIGGGLPGQPPKEGPGGSGEEKGKDGGGEDRGGEDSGSAMEAKATNDAVAFIRSLADMRGRNADWAEEAVREAASLSARAALEAGVVDIVAGDVDALLAQTDGRRIEAGGRERLLSTANARIEQIEPGFLTRALSLLSNPNVAFILLMIGFYGLVFEFANPGSIGPGVVGVICLVLGLYALNQLPLDYAGLALVLAGLAFMIAEAVTPTLGVLGIGGLVAFIIGAAMLIDTDAPAYQLSWWVIGSTAAASGGFLVLLLGYVWRIYRRPVPGGGVAMRGEAGEVLDWSGLEGHVLARGERWAARGDQSLGPGQAVRVRDLEGLTLVVEAAEQSPPPGTRDKGE